MPSGHEPPAKKAKMSKQSNLMTIFATPVSEILQDRKMITIAHDDKPLVAFGKLVEHGILSAPVFDHNSTTTFCGFLAVRDLVDLTVFAAQIKEEDRHKHDKTAQTSSFLTIALDHKNVEAAKWIDICPDSSSEFDRNFSVQYLAKRNPFIPVKTTDSLEKVCLVLTRRDVHRVPVVDEQGNLVDIISQSSVIAFLQKHMKALAPELTQTVTNAKVGTAPVVSINSNEPVLKAYKTMKDADVSAVAVVEAKDGRLSGCISPSDLKLYLKKPSFQYLHKSAADFINGVRQQEIETTRFPTICVSSNDTLEKTIAKLAATKIHRVFVTKNYESFTPLAVISLTDICTYICRQIAQERNTV